MGCRNGFNGIEDVAVLLFEEWAREEWMIWRKGVKTTWTIIPYKCLIASSTSSGRKKTSSRSVWVWTSVWAILEGYFQSDGSEGQCDFSELLTSLAGSVTRVPFIRREAPTVLRRPDHSQPRRGKVKILSLLKESPLHRWLQKPSSCSWR